VVNCEDPQPIRVFSLKSPTYAIRIGRGSKSGNRDLFPAIHNAWFDSRVMSREHAVLKADPDTRVSHQPPLLSELANITRLSISKMLVLCMEHMWTTEGSRHTSAMHSTMTISSSLAVKLLAAQVRALVNDEAYHACSQ
jgi:hypothetical protein